MIFRQQTGPVRGSQQTLLILGLLRVSLHLMFALLLLLGSVLGLRELASPWQKGLLLCLSACLGLIYLAGTVYEKRRGLPLTYRQLLPGASLSAEARPSRLAPSLLWLALIAGFWLALMCLASSFTWLVFPLIFLSLQLLAPRPGVLLSGLLCLLAVLLPLLGPAGLGPAVIASQGVAPGYLVGPLLGTLLAIVVSFTYRALSQEAARQYQLAQELQEVQGQLVQEQYLAGKLAERERLAREIHDTLAQGLSSILLLSRAAQGSLAEGRLGEAERQLNLVQDSAAANLAEARRFIQDLASPALDDSLLAALGDLVESVEVAQRAAGFSFSCSLLLEGDEEALNSLPEPLASALLRLVQGALSNVVEHASASVARVTVSLWPTQVLLDVFDDGRGFDPARLGPPLAGTDRGFGLWSLRQRVEQLGGSLEVESTPGRGTVLTAALPLPASTGGLVGEER